MLHDPNVNTVCFYLKGVEARVCQIEQPTHNLGTTPTTKKLKQKKQYASIRGAIVKKKWRPSESSKFLIGQERSRDPVTSQPAHRGRWQLN